MNAILERLTGLRGAMRTHGISHYLVPSADEHINEYLPRWNARREWLSGFSGSAGASFRFVGGGLGISARSAQRHVRGTLR